MAEDNRRPCYFRNGESLFKRFPRIFLSNQENYKCEVELSTGNISRTTNQQAVGEVCHSEKNLSKEPVCQPHVPSVEKRWRSEASYKPEEIKPIHFWPSLQSGGMISIERNFRRGGLSLQATTQRCFFCVLLNKDPQNFGRFESKGTPYELLEDVIMDSDTMAQ